ncbi:1528_t:CDS:1, partial [Funneliformis caledonium]
MKTNYNSIRIANDSTTDDFSTKYNNDDDSIVEDSNTKTDSVDFEDFCEANFEDAAIKMIEDQIPQWPNEIYQVFAKICIDYDLSNQATDSFICFFNKYVNLKVSSLLKSSKEMHKHMSSM